MWSPRFVNEATFQRDLGAGLFSSLNPKAMRARNPPRKLFQYDHFSPAGSELSGRGRVAQPFGFALTDPGRRISRTRLFPEVSRIKPRRWAHVGVGQSYDPLVLSDISTGAFLAIGGRSRSRAHCGSH